MADENWTKEYNGEAINLISKSPANFKVSKPSYLSQEMVLNDASKATVNTLISYQKEGNQTKSFSRAAIASLYKKLKNKPEELISLISALQSGGTEPSKCVTIRRPWDGKLQFEGWSDWAHITYIRIWRWPEITANQVGHIKSCRYGFDRKFTSVCINPYHYGKMLSPQHSNSGLEHPLERFKLHGNSNGGASIRSDQTSLPIVQPLDQNPDATLSSGTVSKHSVPELTVSKQPIRTIEAGTKQIQGDVECLGYIARPTIQGLHPAIPHVFSERWCSVSYYEHENKVGETFKAPSTSPFIQIDGLVDLSAKDRFCLGAITNVRRTEHSRSIRNCIGQGIQLELRDNGDVWLRCLSNFSVFVQSCYLDAEVGRTPFPGIHQIHPKMYVKVFEFRHFFSELNHHMANAQILAHQGQHFPDTDGLNNFCTLRISFVTGWSSGYPWESVEVTPCWIEVQLYQAFKILDELLRKKLAPQCFYEQALLSKHRLHIPVAKY